MNVKMDAVGTPQLRKQYQSLRVGLARSLADPRLLVSRQQRRAAFSPSLSYGRHFGPPGPSARQAAVMLMLEPRYGAWSIPLTARPDHLPDHPGQISLPGGRLEIGETHQQVAEREFVEELGCIRFPGEVIGELSPLYVYNSDYLVQPFVAICDTAGDLTPCPREVAQVIHLPLSCLMNRSNMSRQEFCRGQARWTAPTIEFERTTVWGATAIILAELSALLGFFSKA